MSDAPTTTYPEDGEGDEGKTNTSEYDVNWKETWAGTKAAGQSKVTSYSHEETAKMTQEDQVNPEV